MKPLIGIVSASSYTKHGWNFLRAYVANVDAIERVGGIPVLIPSTLAEDTLRDLYDRLDGVLLPGGGDMVPRFYNQDEQTEIKAPDPDRDQTEITLARWAVDEGRPVFGICRGHQVMNVALGGTLIQDIPTFFESDLQHDITDGMPRDERLHTVSVDADSMLARILGGTKFPVNSLHHQAIENVSPRLKVTAHAPDGMIEGTEVPGHPHAVTVQWHPEDLIADEPMLNLFRSFVEVSARERV